MSYRTWRFHIGTGVYDGVDRLVTYAYDAPTGKMSGKRVWDGGSLIERDTTFTYHKNRLAAAVVAKRAW